MSVLELSLLSPNAFGHSYSLCWNTVWMSVSTSQLLLLIVLLIVLEVEVSAVIFGTDAKWPLCVSLSLKMDSLVGHQVHIPFPAQSLMRRPIRGALAAHSRSYEFEQRSLLKTCKGLELISFRALSFRLVFDCKVGCMSLSLMVNVLVPLKLQSIVFFYKIDCPLFLPALRQFLFHFSFSQDLR